MAFEPRYRTNNGFEFQWADWSFVIYDARTGQGIGNCPRTIKRPETAKRWIERELLPAGTAR